VWSFKAKFYKIKHFVPCFNAWKSALSVTTLHIQNFLTFAAEVSIYNPCKSSVDASVLLLKSCSLGKMVDISYSGAWYSTDCYYRDVHILYYPYWYWAHEIHYRYTSNTGSQLLPQVSVFVPDFQHIYRAVSTWRSDSTQGKIKTHISTEGNHDTGPLVYWITSFK
jgi:hypothetical protein